MPPGGVRPGGKPPWLLIGGIALAVVVVLGFGGCVLCLALDKSDNDESAEVDSDDDDAKTTKKKKGTSGGGKWVVYDRPRVKFRSPKGWTQTGQGDWSVFKSPDGEAVFAFTTFNRPRESTAKLGRASRVLGANRIRWRSKKRGVVGKQRFPAAYAEGSCNFHGSGGYIWYATVDAGETDQILLIYTVSARGKDNKDAAAAAVKSLQLR